jgi:predicted 3-demethylubiquinone-9 3-methyltransferase (glyoxalase superfamily)
VKFRISRYGDLRAGRARKKASSRRFLPCLGLNGVPRSSNEAFSFQIATDAQHEADSYGNAIVGGGQESQCLVVVGGR